MRPRARRFAAALVILVALAGVGLALTGGVFVTGTITIDAADGPQVDVVTSSESQLLLDGPDGPNTVVVEHTDGTVTFESTGTSAATVATGDLTGTWTVVTGIDATNDLTINPADKRAVTVGGGIDSIDFRDAAVDNGQVDFSYGASSTASVTIDGVPADATLLAVDSATGDVLDQSTSTSGGSVTFGALPSGSNDVQIAEASDPVLDDASASPQGGETVTNTPVQLSIDVSDPDFDTSQGDEVTVTFYDASDDSAIGTDTLTSNGTATTSWSSPGLGDVTWYAVAGDSYGGETTSQTFHFQTPSEIEIRNESDPEQLVSGEDAEVTVTFFGGDEVHERTTTDGTVNMSGLPDEQFVVQVNIDGFHTRQAIIDSITEQQEVYVLPESADAVSVRFRLNDQTGQFRESESTLFVEKPITRDGETVYRVVVADEFGPGGYTTTLEQDQRYRLRVRNADGREQIVGPYSATQSETVTMEIDELEFSFDAEDMDYRWGAFYNDEQQRVEFSWQTLEGVTDYVNINIYERGDEENQVLSETMTDPTAFSISEPVNDELANSSFIVEWDALHNGEEISGSHIIGQSQMPIDLVGVPENVKHLVAVFGIFVIAGLFSVANVTVGAAVVTIFSGFMWFIGWLPGEVTGILIGVALLLVGVYKVANRGVIR